MSSRRLCAEKYVTVMSTVSGCDVTTVQQHYTGSSSNSGKVQFPAKSKSVSVFENNSGRLESCICSQKPEPVKNQKKNSQNSIKRKQKEKRVKKGRKKEKKKEKEATRLKQGGVEKIVLKTGPSLTGVSKVVRHRVALPRKEPWQSTYTVLDDVVQEHSHVLLRRLCEQRPRLRPAVDAALVEAREQLWAHDLRLARLQAPAVGPHSTAPVSEHVMER